MAPVITKRKAVKTTTLKSAPTKRTTETYGAPAQLGQSTRKGKRAWRKNVDIGEVVEGLEKLREDERVTGGRLHEKSNKDLFIVDVTGDEGVRKSLRKAKPLRYLAVLRERSAVPAVFSRPARSDEAKARISREAKDRLRRKAGRHPLYTDSTLGEVTEAAKKSGGYDVWEEKDSDEEVDDEDVRDFVVPYVKKKKVKAPRIVNPNTDISLSAITQPHPGSSYNPTVEAHQELLQEAHNVEKEREGQLLKLEEMRAKLEQARRLVTVGYDEAAAAGMTIDTGEMDVDGAEEGKPQDAQDVIVKSTVRKTRQQRAKAARVQAERRAALAKRAQTRFLATIAQIPSLKRAVDSALTTSERTAAKRRLAAAERIKAGLAGQRLGKHLVPGKRVDVQLGEELSETLRAMKPEGNLFRDRFLSMQHRALVEPRVPVGPSHRTKAGRGKLYEQHMYKRFK